jgi:cytochrome b6
MAAVPVLGRAALVLLRGNEDVTGATLYRFFGLHVAILPGIAFLLLVLHLLFVQRQGMSVPRAWQNGDPARRRSMPFFPNFLLRDLLLWLVVLNVLAILAVVAPFGIHPLEWPLGERADPFAPAPEGIRPEWYFMFMYQTLRLLPPHLGPFEGEMIGVLAFGLAGVLWALVPLWDRPARDGRMRPWVTWVGVLVLGYVVGMTIWGYLA